ncbi:MAG: hypothetical protein EBS23_00640 [Betaproteobacteria bacterium]|nr:hypothetical protein [Betaproteobacteria bacterium]
MVFCLAFSLSSVRLRLAFSTALAVALLSPLAAKGAEARSRSVFEAITSRPWAHEPDRLLSPEPAMPVRDGRSGTCAYTELVGQLFGDADLSIIETPFRVSYTQAPPLDALTPRVTVLVDLQTDRILRVHCPRPGSTPR